MRTTSGLACIALVLVTACAPADSTDHPPSAASTELASTYEVPAQEMRGIRVEPRGGSTIVTAGDDQHRLAGRFTFDALSPDERWLYLVEHRPPSGSENYRVRLLELDTGRLQPQPIADKTNLQTDMSGLPKARTTTSDGVWVFTLYRGAEHAFVHALNTRDAYALCLDLDHGCCAADGEWRLELDEAETQLTAVAGAPGDTFTFDLARRLDPGSP